MFKLPLEIIDHDWIETFRYCWECDTELPDKHHSDNCSAMDERFDTSCTICGIEDTSEELSCYLRAICGSCGNGRQVIRLVDCEKCGFHNKETGSKITCTEMQRLLMDRNNIVPEYGDFLDCYLPPDITKYIIIPYCANLTITYLIDVNSN